MEKKKSRKSVHELARRESYGLCVILNWNRVTNALSINLDDVITGEHRAFLIPPERALDAFIHPYAYLPNNAIHLVEVNES